MDIKTRLYNKTNIKVQDQTGFIEDKHEISDMNKFLKHSEQYYELRNKKSMCKFCFKQFKSNENFIIHIREAHLEALDKNLYFKNVPDIKEESREDND